MDIKESMLDLIGRTPMVKLGRLAADVEPAIAVKLEYFNPTHSQKDRIARWMVEKAEREGKLKPGDILVETTSGNTGCAVAMVAALKGYRFVAVMPEAMSMERVQMMTALGAEVIRTPCENGPGGPYTVKDSALARDTAFELAERDGHYLVGQHIRPENSEAHFRTTGVEIWEQTDGRLDAYVMMVGTAGTSMGAGKILKKLNPGIRLVLGEPAGSTVLSEYNPGAHRIMGTGTGEVPALLEDLWDDVIAITDEEAYETARRAARHEGIFAGISSGANIFAALKYAAAHPEMSLSVTQANDSGLKYLSTDLYRMEE